MPTVASNSTNSCLHSRLPEIASGERKLRSVRAGCQRLVKNKLQITYYNQLSPLVFMAKVVNKSNLGQKSQEKLSDVNKKLTWHLIVSLYNRNKQALI